MQCVVRECRSFSKKLIHVGTWNFGVGNFGLGWMMDQIKPMPSERCAAVLNYFSLCFLGIPRTIYGWQCLFFY